MRPRTPSIGEVVIYTDSEGQDQPAIMTGGITIEGTVTLHNLGPLTLTANQFVDAKQGSGPNTWRWPNK